MVRVRWFLDNLLNFTPHAFVLALVLLATGLVLALEALAVLGGAGAAIGLVLVERARRVLVRPSGRVPGETPPSRATLRVLTVNFEPSNSHYDRLLALVEDSRPDILVLQEWIDAPDAVLEALSIRFPHHLQGRWPDPEIYSRLPLREVTVHRLPGPDWISAVLTARIALDGGSVRLVAVHAAQPGAMERAAARRAQFDFVASLLEDGGAAIVAGDCNATVFSEDLRRTLDRTGLRSVTGAGARMFGLCTWPTHLGSLGIRIDHVLVRGLHPLHVELGPDVGSDHRPLIADLAPHTVEAPRARD